MALGRVVERIDERMALQRRLDDAPLHAAAAAMNQSYFAQSCLMRRAHVLLDHRGDVARLKGVEIERGLDRDAHAQAAGACGCSYVAVTVVPIPPRTEKSPTTVMRRGWHAGSGNVSILPRLIGYGNAARWILTGDIFPAAEAHRVGFVQDLVSVEELMPRVMAIAGRLAKNPPIAVQSAKNIIRQSQGMSIAQGLAWENDGYTFCMSTEDAAEGIKAFTEKREPVFRGR